MSDTAAVEDLRLHHGREMAINRLVFCALIALYFSIAHIGPSLLAPALSYLGFACVSFAWLRWRPHHWLKTTLGCALVADLGGLSVCMHLNGPHDAALFPVYLWVIQGNGFRFGIKPLFAAALVACAGFGWVILTTPYWRDQPAFSASLLAALVVLPAYSSTLIQKLSRARLQAEEASQAKSMFLAAISHELRTPLNAILGSLSLVEDTSLDAEQRSLFAAMRAGTQALLSLIGRVLDFSRVEAGLMPLKLEPLDLASLLIDIRDLVTSQARLKSLQLSIHIGGEVPLRIVGDRKHLFEVLLNLAANAVKFTETGGICLSVELAAPELSIPDGNMPHLRFEVSDTGIGIAPESQERIFDVFSQADSSILDRFGGTGLGLAISRKLVTLMGGEIGVDSKLGQGSSFWFTLALEAAHVDEGEPAQAQASGPQTKKKAALLLCDDPMLVDAIDAALISSDFVVRRIDTLRAAFGQSGRSNEEMLFLYRRDPDGDLPDDCALLRKLDPQAAMPRILLSPVDPAPPKSMMLKRHFLTALVLPLTDAALKRAMELAVASATRTEHPWHQSQGPLPRDAGPQVNVVSAFTAQAAAERASGRSLHVLVADDNEINRRVVGKILERSGHRVSLVEDGIQAMDAMESIDYDLVLMDINMPRMNGLETTRLFRLAMPPTPRLPILALTADATAETERKCLEAGMDGCVTKPFTPAHLIATIDALVMKNQPAPARIQGVTPITDHPRFTPALPALDPEVLAELNTLGGADFVSELLESFIVDARAFISRIDAAVAVHDMTGFRFELHALCSGAANIGAASLRQATVYRDITQETLGSSGPVIVDRLRQELAALEREWRRVDGIQTISLG